MAQSTWWNKVKTGGKKGFDGAWAAMDKLGAPVNRLSNKLGSEAFWPTTLDKESDKAARILKSFCKDGFYAEEERRPANGPKQKQKVVKKIPENVIKNAKGLAIFTTMRTGLWVSGAGGSGILVGRMPDGSWSPPSGILLHTAGLGFLVGVDIYDCVVVINTYEALEAFTKIRCTLGSEISVAAGPVGAGGILETEVHKRQSPIFTYLKSRGFYAGVQIDGTVVIERTDENERFYGYKYPVKDILAGKIRHPPYEIRRLMETIKAAQGDSEFDSSAIPSEPPPSDYVVEDGHFGIPDKEDPDPYGVLALEKEGLGLREAGTKKRASWEEFSFNPSPTSPVHQIYQRNSQELAQTASGRNSWRASAFSNDAKTPSSLRNSMDQPSSARQSLYTDTATQTDIAEPSSPGRFSASGISRRSSRGSFANAGHMPEVPENGVLDTSPTRKSQGSPAQANGYNTPPHTPPIHGNEDHADVDEHDEDVHIEEPTVHAVQTVQPTSPTAVSKARLVTVPKRGPPPMLPPRNPQRSGPLVIDAAPKGGEPDELSGIMANKKPESAPASQASPEADSSVGEAKVDAAVSETKERLDSVKLDDEDESDMRDPWAKVEEIRQRRSEDRSPMPGGFE